MSTKPSILIVEDEEIVARGLLDLLTYHGFEVSHADNGETGLKNALEGEYDLIVLDLMLPKRDGFSVCEEIRKVDRALPILMLTAKGAEEDRILGLQLGADDYVSKPFSPTELVLRIQAILKRTSGKKLSQPEFQLGNWTISPNTLSATSAQEENLSFSRREMELLCYLYQNTAVAVSREVLLEAVWGYERAAKIATRTVDIHIARLRRKLEHDSGNPKLIQTIRGAGYQLVLTEQDGK